MDKEETQDNNDEGLIDTAMCLYKEVQFLLLSTISTLFTIVIELIVVLNSCSGCTELFTRSVIGKDIRVKKFKRRATRTRKFGPELPEVGFVRVWPARKLREENWICENCPPNLDSIH